MYLAKLKSTLDNSEIIIDSQNFTVGRSLENSHVLRDMSVSRCHFKIIQLDPNSWALIDKSTYGTKVNDTELNKGTRCALRHGDIITVSGLFKYEFHIPPTKATSKRRRVSTESIESVPSHNNNVVTPPKDIETNKRHETAIDDSSTSNKFNNDLSKLKKENDLLKEMNNNKVNKILELEIDLFNKTTSNVMLEQEKVELREHCDRLEKEKEDLLSQILDMECQVTLLKMKMEKQEETKGKVTEDVDGEDRHLLNCLLRAEVVEKECLIKGKITDGIATLKRSKRKHDKGWFKKMLYELQTDVEDLVKKRNELEKNLVQENRPASSADGLKESTMQILEAELQCSVCNELFVKPVTLNCKHTFCRACIFRWRQQKNTCPVCRMTIRMATECLPLDSFIDQALYTLSPTKQEARLRLRQSHEHQLASMPADSLFPPAIAPQPGTSATSNRNNTLDNPIVITSSPNYSDLEFEVLDSWEDMDDDDDDDDSYDDGFEEAYYGGYGNCFICGRGGHWANGCPERRR